MININIEPTDFCNARCSYCINSTGQPVHRQYGGFLSLDIHNKIFRDLDDFMNDFSCAPTLDRGIYLRYCGAGEPTMHPDLIAMLKQGFNFPRVKQLAVLSNGSGWSKEIIDEFIGLPALQQNKPVELVFSLDTLNPETQFKIKKLNNINDIIKSLLYLLDQKVKNNLKNLHLILQIIILEDNIGEVREFCRFWEEVISKRGLSFRIVYAPDYAKYFLTEDCFVWIKRLDSDKATQKKYIDLHNSALKEMGLDSTGIDRDNSFCLMNSSSTINNSKQQSLETSHVCSMLWYGITISASADVSPCCSDVNFELKAGNLKDDSIIEIYKSEAMRRLRIAHITGDLTKYPICRDCSILYRGNPVHDEEIVQYINSIRPSAG